MNKVSGICGCTEETSCYGCLRNYLNQFFHDNLSRGLAHKYIDWLLNGKAEERVEITLLITASNKSDGTETAGKKKYDYDTIAKPSLDTISQFEMLLENAEDEMVENVIHRFIELIGKEDRYEHPFVDTPIDLNPLVWPDIFWPDSKVAIFFPEKQAQYKKLNEYNWHCYLIEDGLDPEKVLKHVQRKRK